MAFYELARALSHALEHPEREFSYCLPFEELEELCVLDSVDLLQCVQQRPLVEALLVQEIGD